MTKASGLMWGLLIASLLRGVAAGAAQPVAKPVAVSDAADTETTTVNPIWHTLASWTVAGVKTTEPFMISRAPWRVKFECEDEGKAAIFVNSADKTIEVISGTGRTGYIYDHEGEFYLRIVSPASGTVHVEVQQLGGKASPPMRQLIASYLDKMAYHYTADETEERSEISLTMRGENNQYDFRIFIDDNRNIVYMCVNRFLACPISHPRLAQALQRLMELNWKLLIGKYEWDSTDGEVRLSHAFSTENGLGYDAFAACFQLLVMTADNDYPELMRLMWGGEYEKEPEALKSKPKPETAPQPETRLEPKTKEQPVPEPATPQGKEETQPEPMDSEIEPRIRSEEQL